MCSDCRDTVQRSDASRQARAGRRKKWRSNQSTCATSSRHSCFAQAVKRNAPQAPMTPVNAFGVCSWNFCRVAFFAEDACMARGVRYRLTNDASCGLAVAAPSRLRTVPSTVCLGFRKPEPQPKLLSAWPIARLPNWGDRVNDPLGKEELELVRVNAHLGQPFGDPSWVESTARRFQLQSTLRPRGRPKTTQKTNKIPKKEA